MTVEIWTTGVGIPGYSARQVRRAEDEGWDGIGFVDSQNLAADPFVELAVASSAADRIRLGTAVTNPVTRHPALMATVAATLQAECGGRFVLGIGRGDSSLAHIGRAPAPVGMFSQYLAQLRAYLRGEEVAFDAASVDSLGMAGHPTSSRVRWIQPGSPTVPVDVAATGPKVIEAGARLADRVTLAVGTDPGRIAWGVGVARAADPTVELGAYLPVVALEDRDAARRLISGGVASFARFSVMHGQVKGPASPEQHDVLTRVHHAYDMNAHFQDGSPQSQVLTDDVIDAFGIAGPASYCAARILELVSLGLSKIILMGPGFGADREAVRASRAAIVEKVLPEVRAA